jgi:hypothetical protein
MFLRASRSDNEYSRTFILCSSELRRTQACSPTDRPPDSSPSVPTHMPPFLENVVPHDRMQFGNGFGEFKTRVKGRDSKWR